MSLGETASQVREVTMGDGRHPEMLTEALERFGLDDEETRAMLFAEAKAFVEGAPQVLDLPTPVLLAGFGVHCLLVGLSYQPEQQG